MRAVVVLALALIVAGCDEPTPERLTWPPPPGTTFAACPFPIDTGTACDTVGWCNDCYAMLGCYCDGDQFQCFTAESVCDFGADASCPVEGNPNCNTPPAPQYCSCAGDHVECVGVCPFAECPDYDGSQCTCADGSCP